MNAVDRPEYSRWPDVLIVSTKGERSIASILADGGALQGHFLQYLTLSFFKDMDGGEYYFLISFYYPQLKYAYR